MLEMLHQAGLALGFYFSLIFLMRAAGKRLAGQVTTFDLVVLLTLGVALQTLALRPGKQNAIIFVVVVFAAHRLLALGTTRLQWLRRLVRGSPRPLVRNGRVDFDALDDEGLSYDELLAGLRKLGHASPEAVRIATLEETGHISAVATGNAAKPPQQPNADQTPG